MPLTFAAMTPHPPILIPTIGNEQIENLANTKKAMELLEQELYIAKPQIIFIISPHSGIFPNAFVVNANTHFVSSFEEFGDLATKKTWHGAPEIAAKMSHKAKLSHLPLQQISQERIDHGASVALYYLTNHTPDVRVLPLGYSSLDQGAHLAFGELLKDIIMDEERRVAVIASGDLSHCLTTESPAGFRPAGKKFDETLIRHLTKKNVQGLIDLDQTLTKEAEECGYRSLLILLGILKDMPFRFQKYSYECPFGVGYLVGQFIF
ncbi:MAG: AmmeMemoRadiSam system protein B [Candidatus Magasanikbacteria bacterium]|nr:AmmeMemoRadiSam system protein B [Candidatus Magasanikbacteria bacterium]